MSSNARLQTLTYSNLACWIRISSHIQCTLFTVRIQNWKDLMKNVLLTNLSIWIFSFAKTDQSLTFDFGLMKKNTSEKEYQNFTTGKPLQIGFSHSTKITNAEEGKISTV